jgi:hypothetical protein
MAVTLTNPVAAKALAGKTFWKACAYSADWSNAEVIKAATANNIYITRMTVAVLAAITFTLGSGEDSSAVETIAWTFAGTAEGTVYTLNFDTPVKLEDAKPFVGDGSGAGAVVVEAEGWSN